MADISCDLHTHTTYSHGKGSIEMNAAAAEEAGLSLLGIADHGPGHVGYGFKMSDVESMRADISASSDKHPGLSIKLGVEANIINRSGHLDVSAEEQKLFDFIIAGYHFGVFGEEPLRAAFVHAGGFMYGITGRCTASARNRNTDLIIRALEENDIDIISHPGAKNPVDIREVAACCARRGTFLEINNKHGALTVEDIRLAAEYDVSFILGSDAHRPQDVGVVDKALERSRAAGLDLSRIVNLKQT